LGSTICIKCGSSIDPFSYCELCKEPLNFKCSSCGFVTEVKVHVDCVNANSLVTEDESIDKDSSQNIAAKPQNPMQRDTSLSDKSSLTHDVKAIDKETVNEKDALHSKNYPMYAVSDIMGKSWYSFARLGADIFLMSTRLSSMYYEQFLQYEKAWGYYWTEIYKTFRTVSQNNKSSQTDAI
jgi:hypothetical protein